MITHEIVGDFQKKSVEQYTMKNKNGMEIDVLNYGGVIRRIFLLDKNGEKSNRILAYKDIALYEENPMFLGALIGRVAGRIIDGKFSLPGYQQEYQLERNERDCHHLHGGLHGFSHQFWKVTVESEDNRDILQLSLTDPPHDGYPGTLKVTVQYSLYDNNTFEIHYHAESDTISLCNMTSHMYFNLLGTKHYDTILHHKLWMNADQVGEVDENTLPTWRYIDCKKDNVFDFTALRSIGKYGMAQHEQQKMVHGGYDHAFKFRDGDGRLSLFDEMSGINIAVSTNEEAVIIYTCNKIEKFCELEGGILRQHAGITIETQALPDRIHSDEPEKVIVTPVHPYDSVTRFVFSVKREDV